MECAREALPTAGGYGGLEAGSSKAVGSGAKAVVMVVSMVVGSFNLRLVG